MFLIFKKQKVSIHSVNIPDLGWSRTKNEKGIIQWVNAEQTIAVSVNFFNNPPDIPGIKDLDVLREFYRNLVANVNGGLLQVETFQLKDIFFLKTLIKLPQSPSGMTYVASLTMPFKTCSFVVKVQAAETGNTGMREALVASQLMSGNGSSTFEEQEWSFDPYDNSLRDGVLMNRSEDEVYDALFPHHPLTLARKLITQIENGIKWKPEVDDLRSFDR